MTDAASHDAEAVVSRLRAALADKVDTSVTALEHARADQSGHRSSGRPLAVVHAESVGDIQTALAIAHQTDTPVVTRGAGTGLAGAALAGPRELVISTLAMNRVLRVDSTDLIAVVEPGIINATLNDELAPSGLWWPPDPASRAISTVGGNIATGAGGLLCAKYGVVADWVLGLDIVLADGRLIRTGRQTVKGVAGLNLTSLIVGSEGQLGIIVGATLKLARLVPGEKYTLTGVFPTVRAAADAATAISASGVQPAIMELMDATTLAAVHELLELAAPARDAALLTIQTDGPAARAEAESIAATIASAGGYATLATTPDEGEELLHRRRSVHPALARRGTTLIEDVSVPRSRMAAMFDEITRIEQHYAITIPTVAHAGDGNLHPNFIFDGPVVPEHIWRAADELFRAALSLGGTLTGEHGVGTLKSRWLAEELGHDQWQLQRDIVRVFDPTGIMNPGKVFQEHPDA
ncbi:FAD-binding oxidoreductase [Microbacterium sp. YY-01]|uniref:FAD-binding oxidoreductase n=1 Tax=Microbacterium sp. YY-01 TaxID=3421634 RepID=UPI003D16E1D1